MPNRKQPPKPQGENGVYPKWSARDQRWKFDAVATVDGVQKWSRGHDTKPLARAARDQMRVDMRRGMLGKAPVSFTVGDLVTKHWQPSRKAELSAPNSLHQVQWAAARIDAALGKIRLARLSANDVDQWKRDMHAEGLSQTSRRLLFMRLKEALAWAIKHDMIYRNVCDQVDSPRKGSYEPPTLDVETVTRLLNEAAKTPLGLMVWVAAMTGLRWGEISKLAWISIDMGSATLNTASKTAAGRRTIALGPETVARLRQHRLGQIRTFTEANVPAPALVFLNENGKPWSQGKRNAHWYIIRNRAGVPTMRFHDLRHVHATLLARAGVHPSVMQERLGHASAVVSLDVYTHSTAGQQTGAAEAVEAFFLAHP